MTLSRRKFMGLGGLVVASAVVPLEAASKGVAAIVPSFDAAEDVPLHYMSADTFRPHVGTRFQVHASPRPVFLTLMAVEDERPTVTTTSVRGLNVGVQDHARGAWGAPAMPSTPPMETFALRFRGPVGTHLAQGTYVFEGGLGKIALFIVPAGPPQRGLRVPTYTAIICHMLR